MTPKDVYRYGYDEDDQHTAQTPCPDCGGTVYTNVRETVCEDCGLVINTNPIDQAIKEPSVDDYRIQ